MILYLASDESGSMTGKNVILTGETKSELLSSLHD